MKIQDRNHKAFDFAAVLAALLSVPSVCAAQHSAPHGEAAFDRNMMASMEQMDQAPINGDWGERDLSWSNQEQSRPTPMTDHYVGPVSTQYAVPSTSR